MTTDLPSTYRVLELPVYDGAAALKVVERPMPVLGDGELLVKVHAAGVNPSDTMYIRGLYGVKKKLPTVPGFEGAGVIVAANGLVGKALVGTRVAFTVPDDKDGTWAEYAITRTGMFFPLRDGVDDEQGAMIVVNPLTAWAFLLLAGAADQKAIVHTAAAGALGRWLSVLAKDRGIEVIHVVRRAEQADALRKAGDKHVLDSSADGFDDALKKLTRELGAGLAFDAISGETSMRILNAMPKGAKLTLYGALSEAPAMIMPEDLIFHGKSVDGLWLKSFFSARWMPQMLQGALAIQGHIKGGYTTAVRERVSLAQLPDAIGRYLEKMSDGKLIVRP